jgi:hypothetical protein
MSIPNPEAGLVISYAYLWHTEHQAGQEEGRKDRPTVIVLAVEREADAATIITVLPITHSAPADPASAVEIPLPVKRHLGLDDDRSWIVVAEGNEDRAPGGGVGARGGSRSPAWSGRFCQAATAGSLTKGSSLKGAMVSSVM